ncbi:Hydrolyzes glycerol-phospholipids at the terminal phosphodiesteric bond [Orobanche minor]
MAKILLHGTLHVTIFEVDHLKAGSGGGIFGREVTHVSEGLNPLLTHKSFETY